MARLWSLKKVSLVRKELSQWRLFSAFRLTAFRLKRLDFQMAIMDGVVFRILSVLEGIVLVFMLCFFYLCCGCHF